MSAFTRCIPCNASTPGGGIQFPYGHQVSPRTLLQMMSQRLELDHVAECGEGVVVYATEEDWESSEEENPSGFLVWEFYLPAGFGERWLHALGWFRPVVKG